MGDLRTIPRRHPATITRVDGWRGVGINYIGLCRVAGIDLHHIHLGALPGKVRVNACRATDPELLGLVHDSDTAGRAHAVIDLLRKIRGLAAGGR